MESGVLLTHITVSRTDVGKRTWPSSALIADATILHIENRHARPSQRVAQMSGMRQAILRAPDATVNIQQNGIRSLARRQTHFEELIRITAIRHPLIRRRRPLTENVFSTHASVLIVSF